MNPHFLHPDDELGKKPSQSYPTLSPWDAGLLLLIGFALGVGICWLSSAAFSP